MSYVKQVLASGEQVQYTAKTSLVRYWLNFLSGGLFLLISLIMRATPDSDASIPFLVLAILLIGWPFLVHLTTELVLTNQRVISKFGIISRDTAEISYKKVESIRVQQGIIGRLLGYGSVIISGTGTTYAPIPNISNPIVFRRAFSTAIEHFERREKSKAAE